MTEPAAAQPSPLMAYLLSVLSSLLLGGLTDPHLARLAAAEAIAACQARGQDELLASGQIAGLSIAALDDLRLSALEAVSVSLALKLRGNAAALNRAARATAADLRREAGQQAPTDDGQEARAREAALQALDAARAALRDAAADDAAERRPAPPNPHAAAPLAAVSEPPGTTPAAPPGDKPATWAAAPVQPAVVPLSPPNARQRALAWAGAMTDVAVEFAQGLDRLPPAGRRADIARIGILSEAARRLSQGDAPNRADLLSSTWLAGGPQDQASSASSAKLATSTPDLSGQDLCSPSRSSDAGSRIPKIVNPA